MDDDLKASVRDRAGNACEYCLLPDAYHPGAFEVEHIIARKHRGSTSLGNLAYSCLHCNAYKGPNIAGIDPDSKAIVRLFHPRLHRWSRHFRWDGAILVGRTAIGRATIIVLEINLPHRILARQMLINEGVFPP